ncbi:tail tape measure protein [Xenophilus sp. AP218F]|nr:tail tape measure protein [Xenophilus sp. AP218F]
MSNSLELSVRITADTGWYGKAMRDAGSLTARESDAISRSLGGVSRSLKTAGRDATQQGSAIGQALAKAGRASYFGRVLSDLGALRREMRAAQDQMTTLERTVSRFKQAGGLIVGGVAAGYALKEPVKQTMGYERRLAMMANTAYSEGKSVDERRAGMTQLDAAIKEAVRKGGGNRESAAEALDFIIASGAMDIQAAMRLLPDIQKFSTGTGTAPTDAAAIAIRAMQTMKIPEAQIPLALDKVVVAGNEGSFEPVNMAKWLPAQMATAQSAGMSGMLGLEKLLAANQAAAITAGTKDEAGNNLVNLLGKINSQDTIKDAKRLGINLPKELIMARKNGVDALDAFAGVIDKIIKKDPASKAVAKRLLVAKSKGENPNDALSDIKNITDGSAVGKLIQDRQALMALVGYLYARDKDGNPLVPKVVAAQKNAEGSTALNYGVIASTDDFKTKQLSNEGDIAKQSAMSSFNKALGDASVMLTQLARDYPTVSTVASEALTVVSTAATVIASQGAYAYFTGKNGGRTSGAPAQPAPTAAKPGLSAQLGYRAPTEQAMATTKAGMASAGLRIASFITLLSELFYTPNADKEELLRGDALREALNKKYGPDVVQAARDQYKPWYQVGSYAKEDERWVQQYLQNKQVTEELIKQVKQTDLGGTMKIVVETPPGTTATVQAMPASPRLKYQVGKTMQEAG